MDVYYFCIFKTVLCSSCDRCELHVILMATVRAILKPTNKGQFEGHSFHPYTSLNCKSPKLALFVQFGHFLASLHRFDFHVQLASGTRRAARVHTVLYFEYANDNMHLPITLLGLIVNGLQSSIVAYKFLQTTGQ